jgi:hypothetical protein
MSAHRRRRRASPFGDRLCGGGSERGAASAGGFSRRVLWCSVIDTQALLSTAVALLDLRAGDFGLRCTTCYYCNAFDGRAYVAHGTK